MKERWSDAETLGWVRRDGVTPPPGGSSARLLTVVAVAMAGVWVGMIASDSLCPEHRMWVNALAWAALALSVGAVVGLVGQRAWAPLCGLTSALLGVAIGFIDMVHSTTRGAVVSLAFGVVAVAVVVAGYPRLRSALWSRRAAAELAPLPAGPFVPDARAVTSAGASVHTDGTVADVGCEGGAEGVVLRDGGGVRRV